MAAVPVPGDGLLRATVHEELRRRFVTGKVVPGSGLSTRSLALELGVSQMPVREALSRLAAEGAVEIRSKRRIVVPPMTAERFADLLRCRELLEPEAAAIALPHIDAARLRRLRAVDDALGVALKPWPPRCLRPPWCCTAPAPPPAREISARTQTARTRRSRLQPTAHGLPVLHSECGPNRRHVSP